MIGSTKRYPLTQKRNRFGNWFWQMHGLDLSSNPDFIILQIADALAEEFKPASTAVPRRKLSYVLMTDTGITCRVFLPVDGVTAGLNAPAVRLVRQRR